MMLKICFWALILNEFSPHFAHTVMNFMKMQLNVFKKTAWKSQISFNVFLFAILVVGKFHLSYLKYMPFRKVKLRLLFTRYLHIFGSFLRIIQPCKNIIKPKIDKIFFMPMIQKCRVSCFTLPSTLALGYGVYLFWSVDCKRLLKWYLIALVY